MTCSMTVELVAVDQVMSLITWVPLFLKEQGYDIRQNVIYQDNQSTILLEENGKSSSGK